MKRILLSVMVLVLLVCASAVAVEYPEGTLYRGIYGYTEEIEFLQYQLFYAGYLGDDIDEVDGIFGQRTEAAVKQFQQDHGIDVTGIVCPNTVTMLDKMWEDSMEPQDADPGLFCATNHYANGTAYVTLCQRHMDLYAQAAALLDEAQDDFQLIEGLQSGITLWMEDADSLYESWKEIRPEEIGGILESGNRTAAGPTVPPGGLYMTHLWYDNGYDCFECPGEGQFVSV